MLTLKYLLLFWMTVVSVASSAEWMAGPGHLRDLWCKQPWKGWGFWITLVMALATVGVTIYSDFEAKAESGKFKDLLSESHQELAATRTELHEANRQIVAQSRQVSSLVFNVRTSLEGKRRFAKCFTDLSDLDGRSTYEPLICEDGVAVFRYEKQGAAMTGFYFFPNSEVNEVLSGVPMDEGANRRAPGGVLPDDSEVAKAMARFRERKTPEWRAGDVAGERGLRQVAGLVQTFCRYVFRACATTVSETTPPGWEVSFRYEVDPFAGNPCSRVVSVVWDEEFVRSLHGVTMEDFTRMLLERFARAGIAPKIRARDVRALNARIVEAELMRNFPYRRTGTEER